MLIEQRERLRGEIRVPGDKSISQRAVLLGSLAKGTTEIDNFLLGEDCISTIDCFRKMQIGIEILPDNKIKVQGKGLYGLRAPSALLNTGKSGTAIRLLLGVLSGQPFASSVVRDEISMKKPVGKVVNHLRRMGANINGREDGNLCPLSVYPAKLRGVAFELPPHEALIKSPLILAGLYAEGETSVTESIKSRDHTELMLNSFGADIKISGLKVTSRIVENLYAQHITIPGDISIAAYFITAGLLVPNSEIIIRGVGINPTRTGILDVYKLMGAKIEIHEERSVNNEIVADISVSSSSLNAIKINGDQIPRLVDELPVIMVAAAFAKGTTEITGLSDNQIKESNKIKSLSLELSKMGARIHETEDGVSIEGGKQLKGTVVECYNNSSIAMALSVAGIAAQGETMIRKSQVVDTTFPGYFQLMNKL
ncbi:MAG: 3-phosphoshikimate 1-carboxyvinyltransferase [Ruminiclostridium sp.]|nr:3-phosphoshikimate 1-carboxyvinyltransferase [Ruminiclostridium sp.]